MSEKLLIVNADDFGYTRDVNSGIIEAHRKGILTATTLMANGQAFDDAVRLARENPKLDVGCHLVLIGGTSMLTGEPYPRSVPDLIHAVVMRKIKPYPELRDQIRKIQAAGLKPLHLDTHKHSHLFPHILEIVAKLSEEFHIPFVRRPFDFPMRPGKVPLSRRMISKTFLIVASKFEQSLVRYNCKSTNFFAGFALTGAFTSEELVQLIRELPDGSTEFMCHPGHCGPELLASKTRLKQSRAEELAALVSPEVREALRECNVRLVRYSDLLTE